MVCQLHVFKDSSILFVCFVMQGNISSVCFQCPLCSICTLVVLEHHLNVGFENVFIFAPLIVDIMWMYV